MTRFASWRRLPVLNDWAPTSHGAGCSAWAPGASRPSSSGRSARGVRRRRQRRKRGRDERRAGGGGGGNGTLNLFTWAEYHSQELLDKFGNVTVTVFNSNEEAIAKLQASGGTSGFDLIIPTGVYIPQMASDGLIETLDTSKLANFGNVDPIYLGQTWDPDNSYSVPKDWGSTGWIYDNTVHHRAARDLERLPRLLRGSGERPDVGARHRPERHGPLLLGERHRLDDDRPEGARRV